MTEIKKIGNDLRNKDDWPDTCVEMNDVSVRVAEDGRLRVDINVCGTDVAYCKIGISPDMLKGTPEEKAEEVFKLVTESMKWDTRLMSEFARRKALAFFKEQSSE